MVLIGPKPQNNEIDDNIGPWIQKNDQEIIALENINDDELINLYKNAKVLLFPSLVEGFGWPPLEAAMFGCKVVTSKTGAIFEILGNSAIYIEPNNQESICRALLDALSINEKKTIEYYMYHLVDNLKKIIYKRVDNCEREIASLLSGGLECSINSAFYVPFFTIGVRLSYP